MSVASRELCAVLSAAVARLIVVMLLPVGWSGGTLAAADGISSFVVKFRNEWGVPASAQILPSDARQALTAALGAGFSDTGRTRDRAFTIAFAAPLPFLEARAAVNRVREIAPVLYA